MLFVVKNHIYSEFIIWTLDTFWQNILANLISGSNYVKIGYYHFFL